MTTKIAILSTHRHPRLRYTLQALGADLGFQLRLYTDREQWLRTAAAAKITYGITLFGPAVVEWPAHPFLSGGTPSAQDLQVNWKNNVPRFFNGDLLACCFYALSRYEEYEPFTPDAHQRFPAAASHAFTNHYLHLPVVRLWARLLASTLPPELPPVHHRPLIFRPTYDIDLLWAYHYRGWRGVASGLKDSLTGALARAQARFTTSRTEDPFHSLEYLLGLHPHQQAVVFWLLADNTCREDVNPYPIPEAQVQLMQQLIPRVKMGIHPGYETTDNKPKLTAEIARFREIIGRAPINSRQHFLRLRLPDTYRHLRQQGITHEYSMGYADAVGWRAGTNLPFYWYDLERERATGLTIHSFAAMDVTLKNYLKLSPVAAKQRVLQLADDCQAVGGDFALLWHNSSFAEDFGWAGWREVYAEIVGALANAGHDPA